MNRSPMDVIFAVLPFLPFFLGSELESDPSASDESAPASGDDAPEAGSLLSSAVVEEDERDGGGDGDDAVIVSIW